MIARAEEKPLGGKNYSTLRKSSLIVAVLRCPVRRKGAKAVRGGCQRGAGIITSSGIRGGEDVKTKATRTLWRLLSDITTAMPSNRSLKMPEKTKEVLYGSAQVSTTGDTGCLRLITLFGRTAGVSPANSRWRPTRVVQAQRLRSQLYFALARSTIRSNVRTAIPVGPLERYGFASSPQAVPAISRCAQATPSANSLMNAAAVIVPALRPPTFLMSAMSDLICFEYS